MTLTELQQLNSAFRACGANIWIDLRANTAELLHEYYRLSILVRKLLKSSSFTSTTQLRRHILEFIGYFKRTTAKSFRWTHAGQPQMVLSI